MGHPFWDTILRPSLTSTHVASNHAGSLSPQAKITVAEKDTAAAAVERGRHCGRIAAAKLLLVRRIMRMCSAEL